MEFTQLKSSIREQLLKHLRGFAAGIAAAIWEIRRSFKLANVPTITKLRNADLLLAAYSVLKIVQENKTQLEEVGQTEAMLAE